MLALLAQQSDPPPAPEPSALEPPATAAELFERLWNTELFEIGGRQLSVSGVVIGFLFIIVGFWIASRIARITGRQIGKSKSVNPSAVLLIERMVYYAIVIVAVIAAMEIMGLKITTFAFLGGAIAIGLGFGAQNILNNFISGVILMVEQPIRIGDLIEIGDDDVGHVERIHARFTRVRRTDGIDVLLPNSKLLEETVVNWTLTDDLVRTSVIVGVIYGSPTDLVRDLIKQAVDENEKIVDEPNPPVIIFDEFADNSLNFEVYFWTHARSLMPLREVRSDVRYRIDELFREHDLVIAFPQRDVHLDTVKPLEVRVVKEADASS